jgi:hypothetical protein
MGAVIADWQLPISDWFLAIGPISNRQWKLATWNPSATADGTDLIATTTPASAAGSIRSRTIMTDDNCQMIDEKFSFGF